MHYGFLATRLRCVNRYRHLRRREGNKGFTLMELLVVVAVVGLLAGLILPGLSAAKGRAHGSRCISNFKQFALALQLYSQDHDDRLVPNAGGQDEAPGAKWVDGWLGLPGPDCTNAIHLQRSLLAPYLGGDLTLWRCPSSRAVAVAGITQLRVRTVSLNGFVGSPVDSPAATTYRRFGDMVRPAPDQLFTFMDEREETINDGSFGLQWAFRREQPENWLLRDKPGVRHGHRATLTFADGHVTMQRWQDFRTLRPSRDDAPTPDNPDILWMQDHATWREAQ